MKILFNQKTLTTTAIIVASVLVFFAGALTTYGACPDGYTEEYVDGGATCYDDGVCQIGYNICLRTTFGGGSSSVSCNTLTVGQTYTGGTQDLIYTEEVAAIENYPEDICRTEAYAGGYEDWNMRYTETGMGCDANPDSCAWLRCWGISGATGVTSQNEEYACGVASNSALVTTTLSASPSSITTDDSSTLTWSATNATTCAGVGFITGGATSGSVDVSPNATTMFTVSCSNDTYSDSATATVTVESVDLVSDVPILESGSLNAPGQILTFSSLITNSGIGDIIKTFENSFELDIDNDGSYDIVLVGDSLVGLNGGSSSNVTSGGWTSVSGTHAIRAITDSRMQVVGAEDGTYEWVVIDDGGSCTSKLCSNGSQVGYSCDTAVCDASNVGNKCQDLPLCDGIGTSYGCRITARCTLVGASSGTEVTGDITESDESNNTAGNFVFTVNAVCADGIDNDSDGYIDYPDDLGCVGVSGDSESTVSFQCDDGIDNDGDGDIDYPNDDGCAGTQDGSENTGAPDQTLIADRTIVPKGQTVELTWTAEGAESCELNGTNGDSWSFTGTGSTVTSDAIQNTTTYTLICLGEGTLQSSSSLTVKLVPTFEEI